MCLLDVVLIGSFALMNGNALRVEKQVEKSVEQWGCFELTLKGPSGGNPFVEVELQVEFICGDKKVLVNGFYDGTGVYKARFMPFSQGEWTYRSKSNCAELNGKSGDFQVAAPSRGNHGPVRVSNQFHFSYSDGTTYRPFGTTSYAWNHQEAELRAKTLKTLAASPFNKMRMCVFPKYYDYNKGEPELYPFEGGRGSFRWDRFNPKFFQRLEECVIALGSLGIESDLILFHPYDKGHWGFDRMTIDQDDRYLRYILARLGAYRNVWWSVANEFDFLERKTPADWDRYFQIIVAHDPFAHLRSIHNGSILYDYNKPWVTHASIQNGSAVEDFGRAGLLRDAYRKPVVYDEVKYEGNLEQRWGNITPQEMVHRFWQGVIAGTYVTHGETYKSSDQVIWWAKGGDLKGTSPPRIAFLRKLLEEGPTNGIQLIDNWQEPRIAGKAGEYYLVYLGSGSPGEWELVLPRAKVDKPMEVSVELIDAWDMTVEMKIPRVRLSPRGRYELAPEEKTVIKLPGKPYQAIRIQKAK